MNFNLWALGTYNFSPWWQAVIHWAEVLWLRNHLSVSNACLSFSPAMLSRVFGPFACAHVVTGAANCFMDIRGFTTCFGLHFQAIRLREVPVCWGPPLASHHPQAWATHWGGAREWFFRTLQSLPVLFWLIHLLKNSRNYPVSFYIFWN